MKKVMKCAVTFAAAVLMSGSAIAGDIPYSEDFDGFDAGSDLGAAEWLVFANVFLGPFPTCTDYLYGYGPFPAPNGGPAFSSIVTEGSATPPALAVYSDYNNGDHGNGNCIEASVFQELFSFDGADAGTYQFAFDAEAPPPPDDVFADGQTTYGFIKLLDPNNGFSLDLFLTVDTTTPGPKSIIVDLDATADGKILQWGFTSVASNYLPTGRWYDNVTFAPYTAPPPPDEDSIVETVPTLNQLGLFLLLALIGGLGLVTLTRRT